MVVVSKLEDRMEEPRVQSVLMLWVPIQDMIAAPNV